MPRTRSLVCALALLIALPIMPAPSAVADDQLELSFEEETQIDEFLRTVGKMTGVQFVWNPLDKNIRGKRIMGGVNLKGDRRRFLELVRGLLTFYELVMVPVGPADYQVTLVMDARQSSSILKLKPEYVVLNEGNLEKYQNADGLFITTTIPVEHMLDLRNARNAMTRIVTGQNIGNVTEVPDARSFVVTDFAPNVVAIYRLIKQMDRPSSGSSTTSDRMEAITLRHARAMELAAVISAHFLPAPPKPSRSPRSPAPSKLSAPRVTADQRTNQVLVSGTEAQLKRVKEAIALLDVPVAGTTTGAYMVRLSNVNAEEAAGALRAMMAGTNLWGGSGPSGARTNITSLEAKNALMIATSPEAYTEIRRLIEEMDTRDADGDGDK